MIFSKETLLDRMRAYFGADQKRIKHAERVLAAAEEILKTEKGDPEVVIASAILHDIGIHAAEKKYNSNAGKYQEIEGPPIARRILEDLGFDENIIREVCEIIAHHHSPGKVNTLNFKILYNADVLVNKEEENGQRSDLWNGSKSNHEHKNSLAG